MTHPPFEPGKSSELRSGSAVAIWCAGRECITGLKTADLLAEKGISASVVNVRSLKPFDRESLLRDAAEKIIVTIEDSLLCGGLASLTDSILVHAEHQKIFHFGWDNSGFIPHGAVADLRHHCGLTPEQISESILSGISVR
jgi:transketolase C-terminal domain/subunit